MQESRKSKGSTLAFVPIAIRFRQRILLTKINHRHIKVFVNSPQVSGDAVLPDGHVAAIPALEIGNPDCVRGNLVPLQSLSRRKHIVALFAWKAELSMNIGNVLPQVSILTKLALATFVLTFEGILVRSVSQFVG